MTKHALAFSRRGFTLMEIVIALLVAGILVAVAIPFYRDYTTKAVVTDALAVAEEGRIPVDLAIATGADTPEKLEALIASELKALISKSPLAVSGDIQLRWDVTKQAVIAKASVPGHGTIDVLSLVRNGGDWRCVEYLPASCRNPATKAGTSGSATQTTAATPPTTPPTCPADQEMVTLPTGPACTPKCAAGNERDKANPTLCKAIVCGPNGEMIPGRGCLPIPPKPTCGAGTDAFRGYSGNNDPTWSCMTACPPGQMPGKAFKCIPDPNAKPAAAATPPAAAKSPAAAATPAATPATAPAAAPAAKPAAAPVAQTPPAQVASIKCRGCIAGAEDACEVVHEEITCTAPNNYCITFVDNQDDGSKIVKRGCGNFQRVHDEWYQGTSDDDKCRERINVEQKLAFTCTFGCTTDNCNDNLRPADDSLYQPK